MKQIKKEDGVMYSDRGRRMKDSCSVGGGGDRKFFKHAK
jgi:hypothetical protein